MRQDVGLPNIQSPFFGDKSARMKWTGTKKMRTIRSSRKFFINKLRGYENENRRVRRQRAAGNGHIDGEDRERLRFNRHSPKCVRNLRYWMH